eukprot:CAMPEP_0168473726 /NCGR_PEP_ID=MMETSP0228-20121227/60473_1 /TAXON_ID=133427 /ORGANISM="Protoceratium reticulatum, Strain CCCM 535 (=CCMP 1889)" /LENGTH=47 /DNA_ID= /DNA_START= /DNA_END= /DNA_ORIENTATION=
MKWRTAADDKLTGHWTGAPQTFTETPRPGTAAGAGALAARLWSQVSV